MIPSLLINPRLGLKPTKLHAEAGDRTELMVSVPIPIIPKFAATEARAPLEPPGVLVKS